MIIKALEEMGLTEGEIQVYGALVELGLSSTGGIVKKANIASSKVYEVLQRLMNKGLVAYVIKNGVRYYDATPPERLLDFLDSKQDTLEKVKEEVRRIIPEIRNKRKSLKEINKTVVYTGRQGPIIALKEAIEEGKNGKELLGYGTDEDPYVEHFPYDLERHFEEQKEHKVRWKLIFNKKFKSPNPLAEIKFLPKGFTSPTRTMIFGDKVAIIDFHKPFTTIMIENRAVAESYRQHFNFLWKKAKK